MSRLLLCVRFWWEGHRLKRRIDCAPSPDAFTALAQHMVEGERWEEAAQVARAGLQQFPFSRELQEILRVNWERDSCVKAAELKARIRKEQTVESWLALVDFYLRHSKLDAALAAADGMCRAHPQDARSRVASGQAHLHLFLRDHLAHDGEKALLDLQCAQNLDPECFEARLAMAEAYFHIGATSNAAIQIMLALELNPEDQEARSLSSAILELPPEKADPRELLIDAEETDETWIATRDPESDHAGVGERIEGVTRLSLLEGVSRVILCQRMGELSGRKGETEVVGDPGSDALVTLARRFRRSASLALKRMGFGAFEEAQLNFGDRPLMIFAAGTSVLLVSISDPSCLDDISVESRRSLGAWARISTKRSIAVSSVAS